MNTTKVDFPEKLRALADDDLAYTEKDLLRGAADALDAAEMKVLWHKADAKVANQRAEAAEAHLAIAIETLTYLSIHSGNGTQKKCRETLEKMEKE